MRTTIPALGALLTSALSACYTPAYHTPTQHATAPNTEQQSPSNWVMVKQNGRHQQYALHSGDQLCNVDGKYKYQPQGHSTQVQILDTDLRDIERVLRNPGCVGYIRTGAKVMYSAFPSESKAQRKYKADIDTPKTTINYKADLSNL